MLQFEKPKAGDTIAALETSMGTIRLMFFPQVAPKAVENFLTHAGNGYYDHVIFHRVISGFMIQSGDPEGTGRGGESIWGKPFENEVSDEARNYRGALAMANAGPDTNGSQFYIVQAGPEQLAGGLIGRYEAQSGKKLPQEVKDTYQKEGGAPWLDGGYTVFGRVIDGMDVVDRIAAVKVDRGDKPLSPISILGVKLETVK